MIRFYLAFIFSLLISCSSISKRNLDKTFQLAENKFQDHIGFALFDPEKKEFIYQFNSNKYFTPASNTKILTLYSSLKLIGDSIPALKYIVSGDSLIFWGTGDPSFLNRNVYNNDGVFDFLKSSGKQLFFSTNNFNSTHFGPGWAWDDYNDYYSAERSSFPIYGNVIGVTEVDKTIKTDPPYFQQFYKSNDQQEKSKVVRKLNDNHLDYFPGLFNKNKTWDIPFRVDENLTARFLSDTLKKPVIILKKQLPSLAKTLKSLPADSLYRVMMKESDNFIAEQLLLICSGILCDTLKPEIAIDYIKKNLLSDCIDKPIWVDGSGLSRYNLFTPRTIVNLWDKIYALVPRDRLFALLPSGGKSGTLQNSYKADEPYIFGKTGTLSNNHNLSGFLITTKGKIYIFSFMNNNYVVKTSEIKKNMEDVLLRLKDKL